MARGLSVESINLSGTEVLDRFDDELFRCGKDTFIGGEFLAIVLSLPYSTFCRNFRRCTGSDVCGLNGLRPDDNELVRTETLCVFRCVNVVQVSSKCRPWGWVLPVFPSFVFQLPEMHVVVQSSGVIERSLDGCDVFVGNIYAVCSSRVDCVTSGNRDSVLVFDVESVPRAWPLEATVVDLTLFEGSIADPKLMRTIKDQEFVFRRGSGSACCCFPSWQPRGRRLHARSRVRSEGRLAEITGRGDVSRQAWQAFCD